MRAPIAFAPLLLLLACGSAGDDVGGGSGGQSTSGGQSGASGGANSSGGNASSGGKAAGTSGGTGNASGGAVAKGGSAPSSGGAAATGGSASTSGGSGGGASGLVDCDLRKVVCRIAVPECPQNQVPSVNGTCYGPCVPIDSCACTVAADCPYNEEYTCWRRTHCGPYVD